jgi:hypothetical protein
MATGSPNREFTSDELDALAAAELPVQDAPIPPSATTAPAAASGAPEPTGSAGLITGEGALPARGPAIGPVAQLEAREYSTEELDLLDQANKPQEFTTDELDLEAVAALEDPTYAPTRDEYFDQKATKERLKAQGKIPGNGELAAKAVGGLFVSAFDAFNSTLFSPVETLAKSPATLQTGIGRAALGAMQLGGWAKQALEGQPQYLNEATGEFLFAEAQNPMILAGFQERYPNQPIRATNEEDLKDYEFQNHIKEKGIDAEYQALGQKTAPTELLTRVLTGRNQQETPIESQAQVLEIATDPTNLIPFGAGAKTLGLSRGMKIVSAKTASGIEKLAGGLVKGNDILAERFARVVTEKTGVSPQNISAAANAMTFGRNVGIGGGIAMGATALGAPPEVSATIAGFYPAYKAGLGVLRKIETGAGASKIILRESADATNGLDQAARAAVLANPAVPSIFKEVLERPSQFVSIESTPARLAANQALSPQMRAFMGKLSNPAIVQAVRGSSALATGAVKGAAANVPFALLAANAGQDEDAAAMLAMGGTFGALGGGVDRFTGLQQRRQQAALSDVSRMLVDIELNAGDVGKMMSTQTPDNLVRLAAMQGTFRNGLDFVPLSAEDYDANVAAQGGAGTAGMFVQAPLGERAKVFINLDARRGGVEPHEFGHALLASGALDGQQKYAARAWVDKTYGPEGVQARATEYASNIIRGKNASAFPDGNFEISPGTLAAEMDNLSQGGLARGDMDGLDWARDEIFAETFAKASNTMDFAAIRRGAPAGGNMLTFAESVLGAQARALSASGVRIDPQTGQALDTPGSLFKENPLLATDKALLNQLGTYINNYRQWANDPTHEKPRPNRIAPSGRASDIANNPQVTFYDRGDGVKATTFATQDPATGQAILRDQRDLNKEHAKVKEQIRNIVGSKLIPDSNPVLGPKKTADGRVTVRGRVLPPSFDFLNGFMPHIRAFARQFEALGAAGESMQVRYHAIGSGDTGAFRVNRLGNLEAITREVIPWGWELTKAGNLNATVLDLSQFRNRAMRGIAERNPALAPFDYDIGKIEADLKTYMENHRQELPGSTKIGEEKRDAINAILGIATTKNRERNALSGSFGPGSAIKQFRLDRVDAAVGTGRTGFHFDYDRANRNFMPDKPAPMPDLSKDLPTPKGQAMPDNMASGEQWDAYAENLRDDVESWSPARDTGRIDYEMMDVVDNFVDFARNNPQLSGEELSKQFYRAEKPTATQRKKLNAALENVGQPPKSIATPQGQAMPDAVHSAGYALPKKVPQRGYFSIGTLPTTDGRVLEYHVDPTTTIQPRVAGINSIRGEQVAMLEADRHNTRGDNMGGPLHPFLISNQTVARLPDGRGYKAVWANMNSAFVTRAKNIVKTTTAGHALIQIMKENAHRSNRKFVMDVTAEIDKRSSTMSKDQVDFLHVVLELGAINPKGRMNQTASKLERTAKAALNKEVPMQELADAQKEYDATLNKYQPMVEFLSRLSPLKSHATRGRMPAFDNEFASILSNYRNQPWFESMASKYRNTKFVDEAARFSFNQRGAAMDRITGIPFAPNVKSMLKSSMDFVNGQNLDVVGVVQLSKDADAFAVYFGKNSKEEGKMSPNERLLRNQLLASGSFKPHPSYDWVMLGPENADSFILDTPADPLKLFPDYAKNHPNKNVRKGSKETVVGTMKKSKIPLVLK